MDYVLDFRKMMAEEGYEITPKRASILLKYIENFRFQINQQSRDNPEQFEKLSNLNKTEKQFLRQQLAEAGTEVSFEELDGLIKFTLYVYEQEKTQ